MKITVQEERVFPTLGIVAQIGDEVEVPSDDDAKEVKSSKPAKGANVKEGDE